MHVRVGLLLPALLLGLGLSVIEGANYVEGQSGGGDALFVNCIINVKGAVGRTLVLDTPFKTSTRGAFITFIKVVDQKPKNQQGSITKTGGGINQPSVTFHLTSVEGHGFLYQFFIYGRTPLGTSERPLTGNCFGR